MKIILNHSHTFAETDDIMVAGQKVKALVVNLAENSTKIIVIHLHTFGQTSYIYYT